MHTGVCQHQRDEDRERTKNSFFQFNKLENKKNARDAENEEITPPFVYIRSVENPK